MLLIAWLLVLVPAAIALWCVAAFALRARRPLRLIVCTAIPAVAVAGLFFAQYWATRTPPAEPGWDIFFGLFCAVSGAATMIVTVPLVYFAEALFGRYAP